MTVIIINPISGGARRGEARREAELASAVLAAAGERGDVHVTERKGHAREIAAAARGRGARLVVAWGGDGTVNEVASELVFGRTPLGIVPRGSGNGLARELGIARGPEQALTEALGATPRAIDAGELGGRTFVNMAGVGFHAHVASLFDRDLVGRRGLATYVRISLRELMVYRSAAYRVADAPTGARQGRDDRGSMPFRRALVVALANSPQFGNGARIAPSARLDDGKLDLVVFEEGSRLATVLALPRLFIGGVRGVRGVSMRQVERVTIESDGPMTFHVDGEPVQGGARLDARVHPAALNVCVR